MRKLPALFCVLLFCAGATAPATAAGNIFSVTGIRVDATAASATEAQNIAIAKGRPQAWTALFHRLTRQQDWSKQPRLDDATLTKILRGYSVANEKRSTTRYVADITYVFNPDAVTKVLQGANISYVQTAASKTVLVIPISPGYSPSAPWAQAWKDPSLSGGIVPVVLPTGDALNNSALNSIGIGTVTWADIQPIASRARATEAVVVQANVGGGKVTVQMRRLAPGGLQAMATVSSPVVAGQTPAQAYVVAAQAANGIIQNAWKSKYVVNFNQQTNLTAEVRISSLEDWAQIQAKLASISTVGNVTVVAMDMGQARLSISYVGSADQLRSALGETNLSLTNDGGTWTLSRGAPKPNAGDQ